ncbi:MAG TPA: hypothetical protein VN914_02440 [Polyangia bacterium]|nr:hypothetical protein [Polyangia bacterium]
MSTLNRPARKELRPPSGFEDHLSRRQAARVLGFGSEFKVRELEKEGRLHPVRGPMGSAWYPRGEVLALRGTEAPTGRWSDGQLLALLRQELDGRPRTVADLVVEAGVSIARAERVYRFWLARDQHPVAARARGEGPVKVEAAPSSERRSAERIARDALIAQMRDPDPRVRNAAFAKLRPR